VRERLGVAPRAKDEGLAADALQPERNALDAGPGQDLDLLSGCLGRAVQPDELVIADAMFARHRGVGSGEW